MTVAELETALALKSSKQAQAAEMLGNIGKNLQNIVILNRALSFCQSSSAQYSASLK